MQSINIAVLQPGLRGRYLPRHRALYLVLAVAAVRASQRRPAPGWLAGALLYLADADLVTLTRNVPLDHALAGTDANATEYWAALWAAYRRGWTAWSTPCAGRRR